MHYAKIYNIEILKAISVGSYILYIIFNGICTILTSRELVKLRRILQVARQSSNFPDSLRLQDTAESRTIIIQQRNVFVIVAVCSISHLVKAMQQVIKNIGIFKN